MEVVVYTVTGGEFKTKTLCYMFHGLHIYRCAEESKTYAWTADYKT